MARRIPQAMNHLRAPLMGVRQGGRQSIVKNIQYGSISIGSGNTSNTATITSVDTSNSLIFWLGSYNTSATTNQDMIANVALTNATTVTATRSHGGTNTCVARFVVIEFIPGVLTSVQRGTITIASGSTSNTATITSVSENVAFFNCLGYRSTNSSAERIDSAFATVDLTAATTVTATRGVNDSFDTIVGYQVAEFSTNYIHRTAKVSAALSAANGLLTLTGALGTAISTYPQGGVPFVAFAGLKPAGSACADAFFSASHEFSTNSTYKLMHVRDVAGGSTSGTICNSIIFFKQDYIKSSFVLTIPLIGAASATDTMPANETASKTLLSLSGYRSNSSTAIGSAGSLQKVVGAIYYDGANLVANRGSATDNLYVQANVIEFV